MNRSNNSEMNMFWAKTLLGVIMFIATVSCSLLGWLALSVNELSSTVTSLRTELDIMDPISMKAHISTIAAKQMTPQDVKSIVSDSYPWPKEKPEWVAWRDSVEKKLDKIHDKLDK